MLFLRYLAVAKYYCNCHKNYSQCEILANLKKGDDHGELIMDDCPEMSEAIKMMIDGYSLASDCNIGEAMLRVKADCDIANMLEHFMFKKLKGTIGSLFNEDEIPDGLRDLILFDRDSDLRRSFYEKILQREDVPSPMTLETTFIAAKNIIPYEMPSF